LPLFLRGKITLRCGRGQSTLPLPILLPGLVSSATLLRTVFLESSQKLIKFACYRVFLFFALSASMRNISMQLGREDEDAAEISVKKKHLSGLNR
jgi:hypothetical protein